MNSLWVFSCLYHLAYLAALNTKSLFHQFTNNLWKFFVAFWTVTFRKKTRGCVCRKFGKPISNVSRARGQTYQLFVVEEKNRLFSYPIDGR